jgi:cyclase
LDDAKKLFSLGVEKIVVNSSLLTNPHLITEISDHGGSQSVCVSIDAKKSFISGWRAYVRGGKRRSSRSPVEAAKLAESLGAGEILINAIDRDGTFSGYDQDLCRIVSESVSVPVIACGGARHVRDCLSIVREAGVSAAAAGSIFVFQGPHRAVLIKFPSDKEFKDIFA